MEYFFTSDTHFGHRRIIELSHRPFSSVEEMDEVIITNWNSMIGPKDLVMHLGDFNLGGSMSDYLSRLNGYKHLIRGNHDPKLGKCLRSGFLSVREVHRFKMVPGVRIWLSHYPHRSWPGSAKGELHLHGHCHGNAKHYTNSMDVGVDTNNFKPYPLDEILEWIDNGEIVDHHAKEDKEQVQS